MNHLGPSLLVSFWGVYGEHLSRRTERREGARLIPLMIGEVTPVTIMLPVAELNFNFGDSLDRTMCETVFLENPGNSLARFACQIPGGSAFSVMTSRIVRHNS